MDFGWQCVYITEGPAYDEIIIINYSMENMVVSLKILLFGVLTEFSSKYPVSATAVRSVKLFIWKYCLLQTEWIVPLIHTASTKIRSYWNFLELLWCVLVDATTKSNQLNCRNMSVDSSSHGITVGKWSRRVETRSLVGFYMLPERQWSFFVYLKFARIHTDTHKHTRILIRIEAARCVLFDVEKVSASIKQSG